MRRGPPKQQCGAEQQGGLHPQTRQVDGTHEQVEEGNPEERTAHGLTRADRPGRRPELSGQPRREQQGERQGKP
ncbi:hypothetical protein WR25_16477 [Diploscapter pachys]|uniref:Uncharacterized protein n=1 Tax=Diploscapter pachys TaxID=2018661 RepID=A0A2A2KCY1_9BILA|nr:hypothetical protein WR25_16477 [Diploscapter pachys]